MLLKFQSCVISGGKLLTKVDGMFLALQSKFLLIILISNKFGLLLKQYIFIYLVCRCLSVAHRIFSCGMWGLIPGRGSNPDPCVRSMES